MPRITLSCVLATLILPALVLAQTASVDVESAAGAIERDAAQAVLNSVVEPVTSCFEEPASALAILRVNRSGRVTSIRFMEESGDDNLDRCLTRALRRAEFERASGRSTIYVRLRRD